tara:strand:+ start:278 stop:508 length:231 start_codon:yes stop_codon:yes gene_type:complete
MQLNEDKHAVTVNDMLRVLTDIVDTNGHGNMPLVALTIHDSHFNEHHQVNHIRPVYQHEDATSPDLDFKGYALMID